MLALGANGRGRAGLLSALRPQDVFATRTYPSNGGLQTVSTGFSPDLVWEKNRSLSASHYIVDKMRGGDRILIPNATGAELTGASYSFLGDGFVSGYLGSANSGNGVVAWALKYAPKFCVEVLYTGDGTSGRVIPHGLGIKPGFMVVKSRTQANSWYAWHRASNSGNSLLILNSTQAAGNDNGQIWGNDATGTHVEPTDTGFTISSSPNINGSGNTYVAYLFAHDPDTTNGIVQCFSYNTDGSGAGSVVLGWRPQWLLLKPSSGTGNWVIADSARGIDGGAGKGLSPNSSGAEFATNSLFNTSANGFSDSGAFVTNGTVVGCAIRAPIT